MGSLLRRVLGLCLFCTAFVAVLAVPIGRKTTAEHLVAIMRTRPAREAVTAFGDVARRLATQAATEAERMRDDATAERDRDRDRDRAGDARRARAR